MRVPHLPFDLRPGNERRHGVDHDDVDGARPDHHVGDLQPLFAVVGLRHQQLVNVHAQGTSICGIERVLGVDEDGDASVLLGLRDDVKTNRGLARSLRAEDLDDPTPRDPPDPERHVERERPRRYHRDPLPSGMLTQPHDRALAVLPLDLRQRHPEHLVPIHTWNLLDPARAVRPFRHPAGPSSASSGRDSSAWL